MKRIVTRLWTLVKRIATFVWMHKNRIIAYLKQAFLLIIYHPAAYLGGMVVSGIIGVILGALIKIDVYAASYWYDPLFFTIAPLFIFFGLMYRDGYVTDRFSLKFVALAALPAFIAQHVCIFCGYYGVMAIGSCQVLTYALMPNQIGNSAWELHLIMLGLQLIIHLPLFFWAYYCGFRRGLKEDEREAITQ